MVKGGENVVKIQVEAKQPPRRKLAKGAKQSPKQAIPRALIENMVSMQKVYSIIAEKLDKVSNQLSTLLNLFETAAKTFAENPALQVFGRDKEFIDKMNKLLEQDKIIARTLVMMQEKMEGKEEPMPVPSAPMPPSEYSQSISLQQPQMPPRPIQPQMPQQK